MRFAPVIRSRTSTDAEYRGFTSSGHRPACVADEIDVKQALQLEPLGQKVAQPLQWFPLGHCQCQRSDRARIDKGTIEPKVPAGELTRSAQQLRPPTRGHEDRAGRFPLDERLPPEAAFCLRRILRRGEANRLAAAGPPRLEKPHTVALRRRLGSPGSSAAATLLGSRGQARGSRTLLNKRPRFPSSGRIAASRSTSRGWFSRPPV